MQLLIKKGAQVNIRDQEGSTSLHHASFHNFPECVSVLLANGAEIDLVDKFSSAISLLIGMVRQPYIGHVIIIVPNR
jgi:ankyrin repeat protein